MEPVELLKHSFSGMGISLTPEKVEQFMEYSRLLRKWNEVMNLTAITDEEGIILKHFADSVSPLSFIDIPKNARLIDIGTGAGFPGIPLKIVRGDLKLTLVDSLNKRINFLNAVCEALGLDNTECIHARAEELSRDEYKRESFDYCLSRAVAPLNVLAEYCLPFVRPGGVFAALKGPNSLNEIKEADKAISVMGGKIESVKDVEIPETDLKHTLIIINKVKPTPSRYPRKGAAISKKPIV